jgi:hypothetical protein
MATKLKFAAADMRRIVTHSINAKDQSPIAYTTEPVKAPAIILVHDQGIYVMSNGNPGDIREEGKPGQFVAYAEGFDPEKNDDWWDAARDAVGGDDFAETLDWANPILKMLDDGATKIVITFGRSIALSAEYPKGKGPKAPPLTEADQILFLAKVMKKKVVFLDPVKKKILVLKPAKGVDRAHQITDLMRRNPQATVLNNLPITEAFKIYQATTR